MKIDLKFLSLYTSRILNRRLRMWCPIILCMLVVVGCTAKNNTDNHQAGANMQAYEKDVPDIPQAGADEPGYFTDEVVDNENILEFVTLGRYKGISYTPVPARAITDEDVEDWISLHMSQGIELFNITDRAVVQGDTVIIDCEGFRGDTPFEGGKLEGHSLVIGSGQFIPGFEEQIIGRNTGEEFEIDITFPDDYREPTLAGQPVTFKVHLKAIQAETAPEPTDELVQEFFDMASVAEYKAKVRERLESESELEAENSIKKQVWLQAVSEAVIHKYPLSEVEFRTGRGMVEFHYNAAKYGIEVEDLVMQVIGMPLDEFIEQEIKPGAVNDVKYDLVLRAVAAVEGISITDTEFEEGVNRFIIETGSESAEALFAINGEYAIRIALLSEKVIDFIMDHAVAE